MTPADPIDIAALRARLREYDKTLPRCKGTVEEDRNYAPDFVSEEGRAEWNMTFHHPCCRPEGHDGPCRNTRPVLGWPGFAVVTALLDEVERLRFEVSYLRACVPPVHPTDYGHEAWTETVRASVEDERAAVVAYLLAGTADCRDCMDAAVVRLAREIERGEHRREEKK